MSLWPVRSPPPRREPNKETSTRIRSAAPPPDCTAKGLLQPCHCIACVRTTPAQSPCPWQRSSDAGHAHGPPPLSRLAPGRRFVRTTPRAGHRRRLSRLHRRKPVDGAFVRTRARAPTKPRRSPRPGATLDLSERAPNRAPAVAVSACIDASGVRAICPNARAAETDPATGRTARRHRPRNTGARRSRNAAAPSSEILRIAYRRQPLALAAPSARKARAAGSRPPPCA